MKTKAFIAYVCLSSIFIFQFCFFLLIGLEDLRLWLLSRMGFSGTDVWPDVFVMGLIILALVVSFRNLLGRGMAVRSYIWLINLLTLFFWIPFIPSLRVEDKAMDRINTMPADVGYGVEGNSISLSEAERYVEKIQAVGRAELDLHRFENEIREETFSDKVLGLALGGLPIAVFIYGSFFLFALSRDELSRPLNSWLDRNG